MYEYYAKNFLTFYHNVYDLCNTISSDMLLVKDWLIANSLTLNESKSYNTIFSLEKIPDNLRVTVELVIMF